MTTATSPLDGLAEVLEFLPCATPSLWFEQAASHLDLLLVDHAHCEKKAASTALGMLYRYPAQSGLLYCMSRLAREELRHFEQVHTLLTGRGIGYRSLTASRYAASLMGTVRREEPARLLDTLLVGALVEARSCERFAGLCVVLPEDVATLYAGLLASEARHFQQYLGLAGEVATAPEIDARLAELRSLEAELVTAPDVEFRFHSGPLAAPADPPSSGVAARVSAAPS